jgi:two-component system, LytTR family, response regulator
MPDRMSAVLVDDEPVARQLLESMLSQTDAGCDVDVVAQCSTAQEAIEAIEKHGPDIVFLDVEMPGGDGFDVIDAIGVGNMPATVFVTAYDHYAAKAFDVVAVDYLLKPFDEARLADSLRRVVRHIQSPNHSPERRIAELLESLAGRTRYATRLAVVADKHMTFIPTSDVDRIEAKGKCSLVHAGSETHVMREGLTTVAERLDPGEFLRVHRSHIVRIDRIARIHRWFRGGYHLILDDGTRLTTGGTYKKTIEAVLLGRQRPPD